MPKLLLKLAPHFLYICVIVALAILLSKGCRDRDAYKQDAAKAHTLRRQYMDDASAYKMQVQEYMKLIGQSQQESVRATKRADSIDKTRKLLEREIKQLYTELGRPWPRDTVIMRECCELAQDLVTANEAHRSDDSAKDAAMSMQLDLATERIDTLDAQLVRANSRFIQRDAIPIEKPRGAVWFGVEANIGPVSSGGLYLRYAAPGGKEYGIGGGFMLNSWYGSVKIGQKISFRKKRRI